MYYAYYAVGWYGMNWIFMMGMQGNVNAASGAAVPLPSDLMASMALYTCLFVLYLN